MTSYVWDRERAMFVDKSTREPMAFRDENAICTPMIISDIEPYRSPVDGAYVSGRAARRDDLKKHDCVPYEPLSSRPRGFGNPAWARKHGLSVNEAAVHRPRKQRIDPLKDVKR